MIVIGDGHGEKLSDTLYVANTAAVGKQPVMPDAMKARWQDVDKESPDELVGGERHGLVSLMPFGSVILPSEGHIGAVEGDQPAVGDGDAMGIA